MEDPGHVSETTNNRQRANELLAELFGLLDETVIRTQVDEPLDRALSTFHNPIGNTFSHQAFHQAIAGLITHLYRYGMRLPRHLDAASALAEGIQILQLAYQGTHTRGYEGAYLDARQEGIKPILMRMVEILKALERRKYQRWAFIHCIESKPWPIQYAMVESLLHQQGPWLPPLLLERSPAELVDAIQTLVMAIINVDLMIQQKAGAPSPHAGP